MIVAGPNGSGKSTFFTHYLSSKFPIFINADEIARTLTEIPERERDIAAARQATNERLRLLDGGRSFAFETVFSRSQYWLEFISQAKSRGFRVHLSFICTEAPALNVARVAERVEAGGHPVPTDKVTARYPRSIQTAVMAKDLVDELWLYDNSNLNESPTLVAVFSGGRAEYVGGSLPRWCEAFPGIG